jgi:hypothetical protein
MRAPPSRCPLTLLAAAILLTACGALDPSSSPLPWPIDPDAGSDPARMVVQPAAAQPGEIVALQFPGGWDRGVLFALDAARDGGWERRFYLLSDANGGATAWYRPDADDLMVEMVGIGGPGPDHVPIPDVLEPGDYRICTANALENMCAPVRVGR